MNRGKHTLHKPLPFLLSQARASAERALVGNTKKLLSEASVHALGSAQVFEKTSTVGQTMDNQCWLPLCGTHANGFWLGVPATLSFT